MEKTAKSKISMSDSNHFLRVARVVAPKKASLKEAEAALSVAMQVGERDSS